jgi:hypothetical protein
MKSVRVDCSFGKNPKSIIIDQTSNTESILAAFQLDPSTGILFWQGRQVPPKFSFANISVKDSQLFVCQKPRSDVCALEFDINAITVATDVERTKSPDEMNFLRRLVTGGLDLTTVVHMYSAFLEANMNNPRIQGAHREAKLARFEQEYNTILRTPK